MKRWMHKIEVIVDKAIPPCLVVLLAIIVLDLGFPDFVEAYHLHPYIVVADYLIIFVFVLDLLFKWERTRKVPLFVKRYWLDILAVFPFFLLFRLFEGIAGAFSFAVSEGTQTAQQLLHESLEVEKEGARIIREAEKISKEAKNISRLSRSARFMRFLRPILRLPRFFKAVPKMMHFYEKPHGGHHEHEYMHKHAKQRVKKRKRK